MVKYYQDAYLHILLFQIVCTVYFYRIILYKL